MSEEPADDMALRTLLSVAEDVAPELPASLVRQVFLLERSHQFEVDRDVPLQALQRLLEDYVANHSADRQ